MTASTAPAPSWRRDLGVWDTGRPGPTVLVLAGIHGNEPAGVLAVQRVLQRLQQDELQIRGRVVALAGNLAALAERRRYLDRDLNRQWGATDIAAMLARSPGSCHEDREQRELLERFEQILRTSTGPLAFIDLHTSSADGAPFLCLADTIDNRRLGLATGVPIILGIEETIEGASLEWFAERGIAALAVEGGRHEHGDTVGNHEALLWLVLERVGILGPGQVDTAPFRSHLARTSAGVPRIVEVVRRHAITEQDEFRMEPGFVNFAPVQKGSLLARDRHGDIRAPATCRIVLPLYQALGNDGFFLARPVRPLWLHVARWLRALRLDSTVHMLPGVRRDPSCANTILVDRRVARWFVTEVFHLLGFRKERQRGDRLAFTRRWSRPENRRL